MTNFQRPITELAFIVGLFAIAATAGVARGDTMKTLHVAPSGNDANPGTEAMPFATIEKARQAVRAVNKQMTGDVVVVLRGGTYPQEKTLAFDMDDSGSNGHGVIYRAQAGETPIISGGKPVTGWQPDEKGRWKAPAPVDNFRQLYVNDARATRARGDKPAELKLVGEDGYTTTATNMADWKNHSDMELCYKVEWAHIRCKVQSIKREGDKAVTNANSANRYRSSELTRRSFMR